MIIFARGTAIVQHAETSEQFEIYDDELEWEPAGGSERGMGPETIYQALVDHDELGDLRWTVSEYPVGAEGIKKTDVGRHRLIEDFDYGLEPEPEFDDESPSGLRDRFKENPDWTAALTKAAIVEKLVDWFHYFYEDPANETPYNGREGGYLYVKGGPYYAEEELRDNFEDVVSEDAILEAVDEIQSDGTFDWAPSPHHQASVDFYEDAMAEDYEEEDFEFEELREIASNTQPTGLGSEAEQSARSEILDQIATLRDELPKPPSHGGIGHNRPPEEFELDGDELETATQSLETIEKELKSDAPNVEAVAEKATFLKKAVGWVAGKLDKTVDEFCKSFGSALGKAAGYALPAAIAALPYWEKLALLLGSLKGWLLLALGI